MEEKECAVSPACDVIHTFILALPFMSRMVRCVIFPHRRASICMTNASLKKEVEGISCR
jgi:hypothetical protein